MTELASYLLVLDIGTSSVRGLVYDAGARLVEGIGAQMVCAPAISPDGDVTFDAAALFAAVVGVIDQVAGQLAARDTRIDAVAACTFVTNIFGVDASGAPVTPVLTYAAPGCGDEVTTLRTALGSEGAHDVHDRTGCLLHTSYLPARFLWMERHRPAWLARSERWLSIGDYVLWRLTGERCTSYSVASWTGLLDRRTLRWDEQWLARLPVSSNQLPPLVDPVPRPATLRPEWRARWPALAAAQWLPAVGDGAAANIGSGAVNDGCVALTIGTTGAMRVVVPAAMDTVPDGLWLYRVTAAEGLLGGATTEGGNLLAWLRTTLQLPPLDELERALAERNPAVHGLTMLPFIAGERAPGWHATAQAALQGFTQSTTALDIYQAALEAIAYRFALIYARLARHLPHGGAHSTIVASGGALTGSAAWQQILADVLDRPVAALAETELSARGTALLALRSLGVIDALDDLPPAVASVTQPDARRHAAYRPALAEQERLYGRLVT
jgi:gluconokinase